MAEYPNELQYTREHEWLSADGRVGITDYAQDSLGDVVFVELPEVGTVVESGETVGVIESVKSVSDLYSPAAGRISRVNEALRDQPELINQDPFGDGWIFALDDAVPGDVLSADGYRAVVEGD